MVSSEESESNQVKRKASKKRKKNKPNSEHCKVVIVRILVSESDRRYFE